MRGATIMSSTRVRTKGWVGGKLPDSLCVGNYSKPRVLKERVETSNVRFLVLALENLSSAFGALDFIRPERSASRRRRGASFVSVLDKRIEPPLMRWLQICSQPVKAGWLLTYSFMSKKSQRQSKIWG